MKIIYFSKKDIEICSNFSKNVDTSFYAKRNQFDALKRMVDSKVGKLGELTVYYNLIDKYPELTYPDFNIYTSKQKSWDYDLKNTTFNLHVKTQESFQAAKYGESWIFQNEDSHIFKKYNSNDYVAFVKVNLNKLESEIKAIVPLTILHDNNLFSLPKLDYLKSNKKAVYYEELNKIPNLFYL